jgi:hypothetical protein
MLALYLTIIRKISLKKTFAEVVIVTCAKLAIAITTYIFAAPKMDVRRSGDRRVHQTDDCNNNVHICGTQEGRSPKWRPLRAPNWRLQ